jgi:histidyl-tRNA synthetase
MSLSTQPYKGARDFYPEDKRLQNYMFGKLREVVERYGYEEYDAPILEPLEIYLAKSGQEIVNEQTYVFEDRGGRKVVIRPEMTPTVSRMVAAKRQELAYPLRWFSIPNLWRYERPQRGRLREHWQLNVDIFGVEQPFAELELLTLIDDTFKAFGASRDMYSLRINDRRLVNYVLNDWLGLDEDQAMQASKLIDRMNKIERNKFISEADAIFTPTQREQGATEKLLAFLDASNVQEVGELLKTTNNVTADLGSLLGQLEAAGITNVRFDPTIMRGFDYYTGIVFEVFDMHPDNNRAMLGGGRYDGLVGLFGVDAVPTAGFGWGDVTLANFLEIHHLLPNEQTTTDVYIALVGDVGLSSHAAVSALRDKGLNVAVDYSGRKLGAQLKAAEKNGIKFVAILGETELQQNIYNLKDLASGTSTEVSADELVKIVKG